MSSGITCPDRTLFASMFNDIEWNRKDLKENAVANAEMTANFAKQFPLGHFRFFGPGKEHIWYELQYVPHGEWEQVAKHM